LGPLVVVVDVKEVDQVEDPVVLLKVVQVDVLVEDQEVVRVVHLHVVLLHLLRLNVMFEQRRRVVVP